MDRVDGLLRALARDELLQDDLKQPDVQKALAHWSGRNRLPEEEADDLMNDNYRIESVCQKMVELQACCKEAGIGLPLSRVLAGEGLYDDGDRDRDSGGSSKVIGKRADDPARDQSLDAGSGKRQEEKRAAKTKAATPSSARTKEPTWKQALVEESWRVLLACVCAIVFSLVLKFFRGDNALGPRDDEEEKLSSTDEL